MMPRQMSEVKHQFQSEEYNFQSLKFYNYIIFVVFFANFGSRLYSKNYFLLPMFEVTIDFLGARSR